MGAEQAQPSAVPEGDGQGSGGKRAGVKGGGTVRGSAEPDELGEGWGLSPMVRATGPKEPHPHLLWAPRGLRFSCPADTCRAGSQREAAEADTSRPPAVARVTAR